MGSEQRLEHLLTPLHATGLAMMAIARSSQMVGNNSQIDGLVVMHDLSGQTRPVLSMHGSDSLHVQRDIRLNLSSSHLADILDDELPLIQSLIGEQPKALGSSSLLQQLFMSASTRPSMYQMLSNWQSIMRRQLERGAHGTSSRTACW